jgi:lipid-A-disaccharide synthase-like uncharacterized protein
MFASMLTPLESVLDYWNSLTGVAKFWLVVGLCAQLMFTGRFVVQWIASEKKGMSYIPTSFWWLSAVGGGLLLCYAIYKRDPVFIMGQVTGQIVYTRNLILISRRRAQEKRDEAASIHEAPDLRKAA